MGQYFDWKSRYEDGIERNSLLEKYRELNFNYSVIIENHMILNGTIVNHPEITAITEDEWTGFFDGSVGHYEIFFKSETDAMAFKLTFL